MRARRRPIRFWAIPFRALVALAGVLITYLVVVNALFATGAAKLALNALAPTHAHFDWRSAYSPWFLRVHVQGFVLNGEDSAVQWSVTADEARATFGARDFFSRRVRLHDLRAQGLTTWVRFKPAPAGPVAEGTSPLWMVRIDDAYVTDVRDVWIDTVRVIDTHGFVQGGFLFEPSRRFYVRPTVVRTDSASVFDGDDTIASDLRGTFDVHVYDVDLRFMRGAEIVQHVDAHARGEGNVGDLRFLDRWLHDTHVRVAGGEGPTQFDIGLRRGVLVPGSRAWVRAERVRVASERIGISGTVVASALVSKDDPQLAISFDTYGAAVQRDGSTVVRAAFVGASAQIDNADLARPFDRWAIAVDVPNANAELLGGSGTLSGNASITPHRMSGHAKVDVSNASIELRKTVVTASGSGEVTLHDFDFRAGRGDLSGARVELHDVSGGAVRGFWADVSANPLAIDLAHGFTVSGTFTGKARNGQLPLEILGAPGIVHTVFGAQGFTVSANVRAGAGETDISDLRVIGNSIEVRAHYRDGDGAALVEAPIMNVGVVIRNGEASTRLFASRDWYARTLPEGATPIF